MTPSGNPQPPRGHRVMEERFVMAGDPRWQGLVDRVAPEELVEEWERQADEREAAARGYDEHGLSRQEAATWYRTEAAILRRVAGELRTAVSSAAPGLLAALRDLLEDNERLRTALSDAATGLHRFGALGWEASARTSLSHSAPKEGT